MISWQSLGWKNELLQLNPWLAPHFDDVAAACATSALVSVKAAEKVRAEAARERLIAGAPQWNEWANSMQLLRKSLINNIRGLRIWDFAAVLDLTRNSDNAVIELWGLVVPGVCRLAGATFEAGLWATATRFLDAIDATGAVFGQETNFERAVFEKAVIFNGAVVKKSAEFRKANFQGETSFVGTVFRKDAWFRGSIFAAAVSFRGASFAGEAGLGDCRYIAGADFSEVDFQDNAGFDKAVFGGPTTFADACFTRNAWFEGASFDASTVFDRARFLSRVVFSETTVNASSSKIAAIISTIERLRSR